MRHLSFTLIVCLAVGACSAPQTAGPSFGSDKPPAPFVLAVYNKDNLLATDPVRDMEELLRRADEVGTPYTDVYVVSHGWNYTESEALGAYERYHAKLVEFLEAEEKREPPAGAPGGALPGTMSDDGQRFNPLMIYVAWDSVARPLSELTSSILPFGLDEAISSPIQVIDSTVFFLPSVWKQSLNAYGNAIGRHYPSSYVGRETTQLISREHLLKGNTGYDVPLSEVVFRAMERSDALAIDVHLVGHSFGAKVVALAGIEALRRHQLEHPTDPLDGKLDSVVLFNAAFGPDELSYRTGESLRESFRLGDDATPNLLLGAEVDALLRHVPGKAMVYSNRDFANGLLFDVSQILVNTAAAQSIHQETAEPNDDDLGPLMIVADGAWDLVKGTVGLASTVVFSVVEWPVRKVVNVLEDWPHHVMQRDGWLGRPVDEDTGLAMKAAAGTWNAITYVVPVEALVSPTETLYGGVADQRGLFRHTLPALGRTGIAGLWRGRRALRASPLRSFAFDDDGRERTHAEAPRDFFARYAVAPDRGDLGDYLGGDRFTSFDATAAYDSLTPFVGAHGDLRKADAYTPPGEDPCDDDTQDDPEKIDATLRFVLDWTREAGDLDG